MATFSKKRRIFILLFFLLNTGMHCEYDKQTSTPQSPPPVLVAGEELVGTVEGIVIEPGGKTVLMTSHDTNLLSRFNLETGERILILDDPHTPFRMSGVVVEFGGAMALVARVTVEGKGDLVRVNTATGALTAIASGFRFSPLDTIGIAIEKEGETVLMAEVCQLTRVNLLDGRKAPVTTFECPTTGPTTIVGDVAVEPSGKTALVSQMSATAKGLWRVNLQTGARDLIVSLVPVNCYNSGGLAIESSNLRAFVACIGVPWPGGHGGLFQVNLTTEKVGRVVDLAPRDLVLEEGEKTALGTAVGGIYRVQLP